MLVQRLTYARKKLYSTTFPCHNCAKHIIAAGVKKVVYIEPYPRSKAFDFHNEAVSADRKDGEKKALFLPFTGVGPRRFFDLFSMNFGSGYPLKRAFETQYSIPL